MPIRDPQKKKEYMKAWRQRNAVHCHAYRLRTEHGQHLKREYGITSGQYDEMMTKQDGKCAICQRHKNEFKNRLAVDHSHITGEVRALLCYKCNSLIGLANDSPERLLAAIQYLAKYETIRTNSKTENGTSTAHSKD